MSNNLLWPSDEPTRNPKYDEGPMTDTIEHPHAESVTDFPTHEIPYYGHRVLVIGDGPLPWDLGNNIPNGSGFALWATGEVTGRGSHCSSVDEAIEMWGTFGAYDMVVVWGEEKKAEEILAALNAAGIFARLMWIYTFPVVSEKIPDLYRLIAEGFDSERNEATA